MINGTPHYRMFTPEGNRVLGAEVDRLIGLGVEGQFDSNELLAEIPKMMKRVSAAGHLECYDTEPAYEIVDQINGRLCLPMRWAKVSRDDF